MVLQFDPETEVASLVLPERYIKKKCDKMYHFETTRGIDQMLSEEHRVIYYNWNTHGGGFLPAKEIPKNYGLSGSMGILALNCIVGGLIGGVVVVYRLCMAVVTIIRCILVAFG